MEIWRSSDRNNFAQFFLRHRVYTGPVELWETSGAFCWRTKFAPRKELKDANSASPYGWLVLHSLGCGVCKIRCITWCCTLRGCLAVKFDSCNNLLSSVHTMSVIHSASVSIWSKNTRKFLYFFLLSCQQVHIGPMHVELLSIPTRDIHRAILVA